MQADKRTCLFGYFINVGENVQAMTTSAIPEGAIRVRAYLLWESDGRLHGRDAHYWSEALGQLQSEAAVTQESPVADKAKVSGAKPVSKQASTEKPAAAELPETEQGVAKSRKRAAKADAKVDSAVGTKREPASKQTKSKSDTTPSAAKPTAAKPTAPKPKKPRKAIAES
jgi:hypothetical protein